MEGGEYSDSCKNMICFFRKGNGHDLSILRRVRRNRFVEIVRLQQYSVKAEGGLEPKISNTNGKIAFNELTKRKARLESRFPEIIEKTKQKWNLNDTFINHRDKIVKIIDNDDNVDALFKIKPNSIDSLLDNEEYIHDYQQLREKFGQLTYYNVEMQSTLTLVCQYLLNSIIVELNLRNLFKSPETNPSEFLYRDLIKEIKQESHKIEILQILKPLYDHDTRPTNFDDFFTNLNQRKIQSLLNGLKFNDDFDAIETYRRLFQYIKSSQHMNYEESDIASFVKSRNFIKFESNVKSNQQYIDKLQKQFDKYQHYLQQEALMQQDEDYCDYLQDKSSEKFNILNEIYQNHILNVPNIQHLNLGLSIIKVLLTCNQSIPDYDLFKYLLDNLRALELSNFQTLIYKSLPLYNHLPSVLADKHDLQYYHFQPIIEQNPEILSSLLQYNSDRQRYNTFQSLLSFYLLDDIANYESMLNQSNLKGILSKSKYRNKRWLTSEVYYKSPNSLLVSVDSVYTAIECCINLQLYEYIDSLFNKLLIHGIEHDDSVKVVLSLGGPEVSSTIDKQLLLAKTYTPHEIATKIFTKQIFKLLLKASRVSDDLGRLMWVLPHLDDYLKRNRVQFFDVSEQSNSNDSPIDSELISEIYHALVAHGLEGKINTYDKFLHFNKSLG